MGIQKLMNKNIRQYLVSDIFL